MNKYTMNEIEGIMGDVKLLTSYRTINKKLKIAGEHVRFMEHLNNNKVFEVEVISASDHALSVLSYLYDNVIPSGITTDKSRKLKMGLLDKNGAPMLLKYTHLVINNSRYYMIESLEYLKYSKSDVIGAYYYIRGNKIIVTSHTKYNIMSISELKKQARIKYNSDIVISGYGGEIKLHLNPLPGFKYSDEMVINHDGSIVVTMGSNDRTSKGLF